MRPTRRKNEGLLGFPAVFFFSFLPERQHSQPATSLPVSYNYRQTDADYRRRGERERARDAAAASNNGWENDRLDTEVT